MKFHFHLKLYRDSTLSFFRFLTNEIENQEDVFRKYDCMYPSYVNTNFIFENTGKQKYPNPCSPSMFRNYIVFIPEFANFTFLIQNENDSTVFSFNRQITKSGLYSIILEKLYLENINISKYSVTVDKRKQLFQHKIIFNINNKEFRYKVFMI
jgi:hypothetical protein